MQDKVMVKHYSTTDGAYGYCLREAITELQIILKKDNYNLSDILNLFEISLYIEDYDKLNDKGKKLLESIIVHKKIINSTLGCYFSTITNDNIISILKEIEENHQLKHVFLKCFVKYKVFERVDNDTIEYMLDNDLIFIYDVLHIDEFVKQYDSIIKIRLLLNNETAELFVRKYDYTEKEEIHFPSLSELDKETIISNYISKNDSNINYLRALFDHVDSKDSYKVTPKQRIELKKVIQKKNNEIHETGVTFGHELNIIIDKNIDDIVKPIFENKKFSYIFPGKWFDNNLDYPTLFNNFIYVFNYVDFDINISNLANINNEGVFTRHLFNRIKTNYATGFAFNSTEAYNTLSFYSYVKYLKENHNIDIEKMIEWFFNEYLSKEFSILNFNISLSIDEKYINRCKVLFPEFDSILKKYKIYAEYHTINNELLEATREAIKIDDCPSLIEDKYLIINKDNIDIKNILNLLFSDQSHISYVNSTLKDSTFAKLILKNKVNINDYEEKEFQLCYINYLLDKKIIYLEDGIIKIDRELLATCKYLYDNNYIRNHNSPTEKDFITKGYLKTYSRLFSPEEANYLNYNLTNSKYGDAKALSNKYRHGNTTLENEDKIFSDYLIGLRMLILIIIKINDELCRVNN